MAVDTRSAWIVDAETAVAALRGVESVRILADGDSVREIHVLSTSNRPAKQIVRDVQSVLVTRFGREIDYRVVSVAYCEPVRSPKRASVDAEPPVPVPASPPAALPSPSPSSAPLATAPVAPASDHAHVTIESAPPATLPARPAAARREAPAEATGPVVTVRPGTRDDRIRYVGVNLFVAGSRTQAQVELRWKGLPRMGSSSGFSTRDGAARIVAMATVAAVQEYLADELALAVDEVAIVRLSRRRAVVVTLSVLTHRSEKPLTGSCLVETDLQQAVVLATLSALNRLIGGLRVKEPTEYVLRPAST